MIALAIKRTCEPVVVRALHHRPAMMRTIAIVATLVACTSSEPIFDDPEYEDESEVDGHAYDEELDIPPEVAAAGELMRVCGASSLNQRSGPGTSYAVLRAIPEDELVTILASSGNWRRNDWNGLVGWSSAAYLCTPNQPPGGESASESIDRTNAGRLEDGVHVAEHPRYVVANTGRNAYYGTEETVLWLADAFDQLGTQQPTAPRPQIRDLSVRLGGRPSGAWPHASHQSGRDVDITYPRKTGCSTTTGCPLEDVSPTTLDARATWTILERWLELGVARRIFIDSGLHEVLRAEARARGHSNAELAGWFGPVIQHVSNHRNHLHVRFVCPDDDDRCIP